MTEAVSSSGTQRVFHHQRMKDHYFALTVALLATLLHTCALFAEFVAVKISVTLASPAVLVFFIVIELGLAANVVGLWSRRSSGMLASVVALLCVIDRKSTRLNSSHIP